MINVKYPDQIVRHNLVYFNVTSDMYILLENNGKTINISHDLFDEHFGALKDLQELIPITILARVHDGQIVRYYNYILVFVIC